MITLLSACSSKPREVQATIPLVAPSVLSGDPIAQEYWETLESATSTSLVHENNVIELGEVFTSALGLKCRKLIVSSDTSANSERVACANISADGTTNQWFLTRQIVHSATAVEIN